MGGILRQLRRCRGIDFLEARQKLGMAVWIGRVESKLNDADFPTRGPRARTMREKPRDLETY